MARFQTQGVPWTYWYRSRTCVAAGRHDHASVVPARVQSVALSRMTVLAPDGPGADARGARYPLLLLAAFAVWWALLAIAPWYRQDWLLENLLVFVAVPLLAWSYPRLRLSDASYTCLFVFLSLHAVGAHYTYAEVPYDRWAQALTGHTVSDALGLQRNHFDRLVHFLYGLLVTPAAIELLDARAPQRGPWRWLVPLLFMVSHSTIYELVEWGAATVFGGELGQAYLGTQGDLWDAQKDSALAGLGTLIAVGMVRLRSRRRWRGQG